MQIEKTNHNQTVLLEDISAGDCFRFPHSDDLYLKTSYTVSASGNIFAVRLDDGTTIVLARCATVMPVRAKVVVL